MTSHTGIKFFKWNYSLVVFILQDDGGIAKNNLRFFILYGKNIKNIFPSSYTTWPCQEAKNGELISLANQAHPKNLFIVIIESNCYRLFIAIIEDIAKPEDRRAVRQFEYC